MKLDRAQKCARKVINILEPFCEKIETAGSIRRKKPEVKDIEIVALPKGTEGERRINRRLKWSEKNSSIQMIKNGEKYKQFTLIKKNGLELIKVDLFIVTPPAQWGVIFLIRTGSAEFSKWIVNIRKREFYSFSKGQLLHNYQSGLGRDKKWKTEVLVTPEEKDVFQKLRIEYIYPENRTREFNFKNYLR